MSAYGAQIKGNINDYAKKNNAIVVDLRSDTLTKPSKAMRLAMSEAVVGDDVYGEDPTVNELEARAAELLGKDAALFVPSGTMGNLIAVMVHCNERGCEAYCGEDSHTILHEQGGAAQLAGVTLCPIPTADDGSLNLQILQSKLRKDRLHEPTSKLVIIENPTNGRIVSQAWIIEKLSKFAKERNLKLHMDGARLWNAVVATKIPVEDIARPFDSITFCLSKGLGAPAGSLLCGSEAFIRQARRVRKVLGGGMRQVGVLAAAGIVALDETIPLLHLDHEKAQKIAAAINAIDSDEFFQISSYTVETNMVFLNLRKTSRMTAENFVAKLCAIESPDEPKVIVQALALTDTLIRFVFYRDITDRMLEDAISKITYVLGK